MRLLHPLACPEHGYQRLETCDICVDAAHRERQLQHSEGPNQKTLCGLPVAMAVTGPVPADWARCGDCDRLAKLREVRQAVGHV
jgi:hypothetical protein